MRNIKDQIKMLVLSNGWNNFNLLVIINIYIKFLINGYTLYTVIINLFITRLLTNQLNKVRKCF